MRRLVSLAVPFLFAVPLGVSLSGCSKAAAVTYCDASLAAGPVAGQVATIDLEPRLTGYSINEGSIESVTSPSAKDCKNNSVSISSYTYASSNISLLDIQPSTGRMCAGTWNRNTGGGIADYTFCTANNKQGVAYLTASGDGVTSNAIPVFVHPTVTSIVFGNASTNCSTDPASNCIDLSQTGGCDTGTPSNTTTAYDGLECISQGVGRQLVARTFAGSGTSQTNISCLVGPLTFSAQNSSVVTIDANGLATAAQPGSSIINAATTQTSSSTGFFSTCPPASIVLSKAGSTGAPTAPITVSQNVSQDLIATITDTNGNPITNLSLEYESTVPQTIPVASGSGVVTPTFPGAATITAICAPSSCNASPLQQVGLYGNGLTVTSNPVQINAVGTGNSTVLYIGSTGSQYLQPYDFTVPPQSAPTKLPYVPNSMVISEDLSSIYMGSANELMVYNTTTNAITREDTSVNGTVLSVSPSNSIVVMTDPNRQLIYLLNSSSSGSLVSQYGGVGTHAQWSPDSSTVYITTTDGRLLVYSTFLGWTQVALPATASDLAVTVPSAGVYLAGTPMTGRTNCPVTTTSGTYPNEITTNTFYPLADTTTLNADQLTATNDGAHILGASTTRFADLSVSAKNGACPVSFTSAPAANPAFTTATPTAIVDVLATTDSAFAFVTYTGAGAVVPEYTVASRTLSNIALQTTTSGTPIAPVKGIISSDNQTLYVGTSGDSTVHILTRGTSTFADTTAPLTPKLPAASGSGLATPNLIVQKPRRATS